jgi:hypothetical protein
MGPHQADCQSDPPATREVVTDLMGRSDSVCVETRLGMLVGAWDLNPRPANIDDNHTFYCLYCATELRTAKSWFTISLKGTDKRICQPIY